jgi:hypothetical protein
MPMPEPHARRIIVQHCQDSGEKGMRMSVFHSIRRIVVAAMGAAMLLGGSVAGVLAYPEPLYPYHAELGRLSLHSDRAFDPLKARAILADVERRLAAVPPEIADPHSSYRIFVSNAEWRRRLTFLWAYGAGGVNFYPIAGSVFLRQSDIDSDRVLRSDGTPAPAPRTLAYYAAHEIGHSLIGKRIGAITNWRLPKWKKEGLADYIGFGGDVDIDAMAAQLSAGNREFDPDLGFYARYRLLVAYLIEREGWSVDRLLRSNISQAEVEGRLLSTLRQ